MVLPIGDYNPTRRTAWVTGLLIAINVAVFAFVEPWSSQDPCQLQAFFLRWATVPAEIAQGQPLRPEQIDTITQCPISWFPDKEVWLSILSSMFLHANWLHLLGNMLYLLIFGNNVEDVFGHVRFLVFYLLAGFVAATAFIMSNFSSLSTLVGASGAIAGVLGAYLVLFPRARVTSLVVFFPVDLPAVVVLGLWFVFQLVELDSPASGGGVAYLAHVAGFVFGVLATLVYRPAMTRRRRRRQPAPRRWSY